MGRLLAFDFGMKRTGVAETDDMQIIASPLETVDTRQVMEFVKKYTNKYQVSGFVVGDPNGTSGITLEISKRATAFSQALQKEFPAIPVFRLDERFTSKMAQQELIAGGMKKKDRQVKGNLDKVSAAIILRDFLASRSGNLT